MYNWSLAFLTIVTVVRDGFLEYPQTRPSFSLLRPVLTFFLPLFVPPHLSKLAGVTLLT